MLSLSIDHSITAADPSVWKAPLVPLFSSKHKKGVRKGSVRMGNTNQRLRRPPPLFFAFDHQNRRVINNQIRNAPNRPPWVRLGRAIDRNLCIWASHTDKHLASLPDTAAGSLTAHLILSQVLCFTVSKYGQDKIT
jgi:hypothetical protein